MLKETNLNIHVSSLLHFLLNLGHRYFNFLFQSFKFPCSHVKFPVLSGLLELEDIKCIQIGDRDHFYYCLYLTKYSTNYCFSLYYTAGSVDNRKITPLKSKQ